MSDFDDVLERLIDDVPFRQALAEDPDTMLAGYSLSPDERALLHSQVQSGSGAERTVEMRTSKSGMVGLLGPLGAVLGMATGQATGFGGVELHHPGPGSGDDSGGHGGFGDAAGHGADAGKGGSGGHGGFGGQGGPGGQGGSVGAGAQGGSDGQGGSGGQGGSAGQGGSGGLGGFGGSEPLGAVGPAPGQDTGVLGNAAVRAHDYEAYVDVNGDGRWDASVAYQRPDGGVDIVADVNHDGRVDFIGHDDNRDGLVDSADFDNDFDGTFETKMYDDNGDGWMDRSQRE
jgi:hypothetical protein